MSKKKKKSQFAVSRKLSENEAPNASDGQKEPEIILSSDKEMPENDLVGKLGESVKDVWYMSETDAEITVFVGKKTDSVTKEVLCSQIAVSPEINIEERNFAEFFENLTKIQDWYGDEEKETAKKFSTIQNLLEENLKDLKVFKVGQIEIDIYAVGLDSQSVLTGIQTKAVET